MKEIIPDQVNGTVLHEGYSNTYTFPVYTKAEGRPGNKNYAIEDFKANYSLLKSRQYTITIEEDSSSVGLTADVLNANKEKVRENYRRLDSVLRDIEDIDNSGSQTEQDLIGGMRTRAAIEKYDYIKYNSRYYKLAYEEPEEIKEKKISFDAKLFGSDIHHNDPAKMQLELKIEADENVSISSGAPYPFKVLRGISEDSWICLSSKAYQESEHVSNNLCSEGGFVDAIGLNQEHRSGEVIKQNYTIKHQNIRQKGSYLVEEWFDYLPESFVHEENENDGVLRYEIRFNLTKSELPEPSSSKSEAGIDAEPPEIMLVAGNETIHGSQGSSCWSSAKGSVCGLSVAAPEIVENQKSTNVSQDVSLRFESDGTEANKYTYRVHSLDGNNSRIRSGNATNGFNVSTLEPDVYAVSGSGWWDKGDVTYAFKIRLTE